MRHRDGQDLPQELQVAVMSLLTLSLFCCCQWLTWMETTMEATTLMMVVVMMMTMVMIMIMIIMQMMLMML